MMIKKVPYSCLQYLSFLWTVLLLSAINSQAAPLVSDIDLEPATPKIIQYQAQGSLIKKMVLVVDNPKNYANFSLYANDELLLDSIDIPHSGQQQLTALIKFPALGKLKLSLRANNAILNIHRLEFIDIPDQHVPQFEDISVSAGIDKVSSIKYGGPTIADIDSDGDYDFIVNNHNEESSKLYWNNGDGTVTKHSQNLARWFMHDLHGTAAGDYDNDGDLDLVVTQGGGNGTDPSKANFYTNDNGTMILTTGDVGINKGGRGRAAQWSDMDLDGDLDLMLINESSLSHEKPQHFFYENKGDGTFTQRTIAGLQDQEPSRSLITDLNHDNIDDVILFGPLSVWLGNGDFTFTDITAQFPAEVIALHNIMAVADLDIDNDGDQDLYLARGKEVEHGKGEAPAVDHDPITQEFSIKPRGFKGVDKFEFTAAGKIKLHNYYFLAQGEFRGKDYPFFLGSKKTSKVLSAGQELEIDPSEAQGWPNNIAENGVYFGYLGNGHWKAALVRNGDIFWNFKFSLSGVTGATTEFIPENRNMNDILLRNDGGKFTDVSREWQIQPGGNTLGVTTGDFNNDSHQDLFLYRWGNIGARISDYILLNDGKGHFYTLTQHGANDVGGPGNGDMGQAFDFDLDGGLDLLNGSECGEWYLYRNKKNETGHYALVRVGYSPKAHVDAIGAEVKITTAQGVYRKRVGSAGGIFSQSLLNIVHFGLGSAQTIERISIRWRNGETQHFTNKPANQLFDTDKADVESLQLEPAQTNLRQGTKLNLSSHLTPANADTRLQWSSSDKNIIAVDQQGQITALGNIGQSATITATSPTNGVNAQSNITIEPWFAVQAKSLTLEPSPTKLLVGESLTLTATLFPAHADNSELIWSTSNIKVVRVDTAGTITALQPGTATIKVASAKKPTVKDTIKLDVAPTIAPFIKFTNEKKLRDKVWTQKDKISLTVEYHAGSGNKVIASDEGGVRFWLRHFQSKWVPVKDRVLIDASALKTESGKSTMTFSLENLIPSAELPAGQFYQLRASFVSSNGKMYDATIDDIKIVPSVH
ncbi:FG-GAP-like repeat-containing protein [Cellvibrio sp. KY-YJ-3]|uniref:FG-GAP-like repeat-containing protein n=1 Tax=Cellvibrio sp. KY-YJ-3 TaxID=454662 RepID=UPI001CD98C5E|nr:FG-GAP-like repeat-containing protein [Cellvibrio sp. KY-YJ-3]